MRREVLERPFPPELVRTRRGRGGAELRYVEGATVIERLNEAFDSQWSFEVVREDVREDEVVVLGRLTASSVVKMAFGSSDITRAHEDGRPISLGDDLKAASTDALKKAASLLGVALDLYGGGLGGSVATNVRSSASRPVQVNGHLTQAQLRAIHALRRRRGWSDAELAEWLVATAQVSDVSELDKQRASEVITRLRAVRREAS